MEEVIIISRDDELEDTEESLAGSTRVDDASSDDMESFPHGRSRERHEDPRMILEYYRTQEDQQRTNSLHTVHQSTVNVVERLEAAVMMMRLEYMMVYVEVAGGRKRRRTWRGVRRWQRALPLCP